MEVRTRDFGTVRISVRRTVEVEPQKDNGLPGAILECSLRKFDLCAGYIEHEILPLVKGYQGERNPLPRGRENPVALAQCPAPLSLVTTSQLKRTKR